MADKPKKRLVKNPETFRERAIKAADEGDKPKRTARVKSGFGKVLGPVFRPIGKAAKRVTGLKIFRPLRRPVRLIGLILFPLYFRNSWKELKQVKWPSWQESRKLTFAVIVFAVIFAVIIAVVDYGLDKVFKNVLLK